MDKTQQPGIEIKAFFVDRLEFTDIDEIRGGRPAKLSFDLKTSGSIAPDGSALEVQLSLKVRPETGPSPFALDVTMTGRFGVVAGNENMNLIEFSRVNAPALIFPFLRDVVANVTLRSRNGVVMMPPVNVVALATTPTVAARLNAINK